MTQIEAAFMARQKYGPTAKVFPKFIAGHGGDTQWWVLAVGTEVIGARRELSELPALIERGQVMGLLDVKTSRPNASGDQSCLRSDTSQLDGSRAAQAWGVDDRSRAGGTAGSHRQR